MNQWLALSSFFCAQAFSQTDLAQQGLPEGSGKALVENVCTSCHRTATITRAAGLSKAEQWASPSGAESHPVRYRGH
jgi:cytochrome c5